MLFDYHGILFTKTIIETSSAARLFAPPKYSDLWLRVILWTWPSSYNYAVSCAQLLQRSTLRVVNFRPCTTVSLTHGNIIRDRDNFRRNNEIAPLFKDTKTNKLTSLIISNDITINAVTVITLHWNLQRKDNTQNFEILFTILRE